MYKLKDMLPHQFERFFQKLVCGECTYKNRFNQILDFSEENKTQAQIIHEIFASFT